MLLLFTLCHLHNVPFNHAFPGHQPVDWLRPVLVSFLKEDKTKKRIEKEKKEKTLFFSGSSPVALPRSWEWVEWPWLDTENIENIENIGDGVDYEEDEDSDDDDDNDGDGDDDDALDDDGLDYVNYDNIDKYDADADDDDDNDFHRFLSSHDDESFDDDVSDHDDANDNVIDMMM